MDLNTIAQLCIVLAPHVIGLLSKRIKAQSQDSAKVSEAVARHIGQVARWASTFQFFGMSSPQLITTSTIALGLSAQPRRFQSMSEHSAVKHEADLLSDPYHCLMLGEPGSGKTTTLKRIALKILTESPVNQNDVLQYPMVIRLREMSEGDSLYDRIADLLGLSVERKEIITYVKAWDQRGRIVDEPVKHIEIRIGDKKVEDAIPLFLNESRALLLLDGLDELRTEHREQIREEIIKLGRCLATSKIVVSCRSGDYTTNMEGFTVHEICPLTAKQIVAIKDRWLGTADTRFMKEFRSLPYYDVADRPLLLTQLLFLYKRYGYLPDQPSDVYARLVRLLLEEWDAQSSIRRDSKYAGFDPTKKAEFLATLSYQLTYALQVTSFKEQDLVRAYLSICDRFGLPRNEATKVAQEIQTHTGIILVGPADVYEFCHLSLQEYLCADYIVRAPLETQSITYLARYAAPLAVAVALSSNPSDWLANLILSFRNLNDMGEASIISLLSRVMVERPNFQKSGPLGFAMLRLFNHYQHSSKVCQHLRNMLKIRAVLESVATALRSYTLKGHEQRPIEFVQVIRRPNLVNTYSFEIPSAGAFPKENLSELKKIGGVSLLR